MADLAIYGDGAGANTITEWLRLLGLEDTAARVEPGLVAEELAGTSVSWAGLRLTRESAWTVPFQNLCSARDVAMWLRFVHLHLVLGSAGEANSEIIRHVLDDDGAKLFLHQFGQLTHERYTVPAIVALAGSDAFLESAWDYAKALFPLAVKVAGDALRAHVGADAAEQQVVETYDHLEQLDLEQLDLLRTARVMPLEQLEVLAEQFLHRYRESVASA
jgi:hypothetical protein